MSSSGVLGTVCMVGIGLRRPPQISFFVARRSILILRLIWASRLYRALFERDRWIAREVNQGPDPKWPRMGP